MNVLIIGNGGREHAIGWKLRQSSHVKELFFTPENAGLSKIAQNSKLNIEDFEGIKTFCKRNAINLAIIGPEAPLVGGLSDYLQDEGITVFGPRQGSAKLEGSKTFAKELMVQNNIATAEFASFTDKDSAMSYILERNFPQVIKADGLAAGKGVVIVNESSEADELLEEIFNKNKYGSAGKRVIVEEFLVGQEVSLLAFTDGITVYPMVEAQDYKAIYDEDKGPNTGGMGCYSPVPSVSAELLHDIVNQVVEPTVYAMATKGLIYQGVIYTGLILTENGPKVLEYNARFGDPETQVILPRMKSDLFEVMISTANQDLKNIKLEFDNDVCLSVVLASGGYPQSYQSDFEIKGIEAAEDAGAIVFHAGTYLKNGKVYTNGGRVLNVTAKASDFKKAREIAYNACDLIDYNYKYCRSDIGLRAIDYAMSGR